MKKLIVNADDLGYSKGINKGIIEAYEKGIVTSTTLMVNGSAVKEAVELIRRQPKLGVGLHFVLTDENQKILRAVGKVVGVAFAKRVGEQLHAQFEKFQNLTGKIPDHIDAHHHVHRLPRIYPYFAKFAREYKVPLRDAGKVKFIDEFFGMNEITRAQELARISVESLLKILGKLPNGVSELMCHPGYVIPGLKSSYGKQREIELQTLTDPKVKDFIRKEGIKLINFGQL